MSNRYKYTKQDMIKFSNLWNQGNTCIQIANLMNISAKEADAISHACRSRNMITRRKRLNKVNTVKKVNKIDIKNVLIATIDKDVHKMDALSQYSWELLKSTF